MTFGHSVKSFHIVKRIAMGGFGIVDEGVGPNGEPVAIKNELASNKVTRPILEHEYHVYKALAGHECIPGVMAYGRQGKFNIMVMDLLGPSLGDRFRRCAKQFSLRTTVYLALGMLDAIEYIHSQGFIHRDIKPENFLLGREAKSHIVYPVDFGLARRWRRLTTITHTPSSYAEEGLGAIGTLPFASIHAHLGQPQTRRDDLHAFVYTILLFTRGSLPWSQIRGGTRKHCARRVFEKKRTWTAARLCQDLPHELEALSSYCFDLGINEEPEYHLLRDNLFAIANQEGWNADVKFEWEEPGWTEFPMIKSVYPLPGKIPQSHIKRGDVVFLKLIPEKSLDYEPPPRPLDTSFFPHQTLTGVEWQFPYRPAVVHKVMSGRHDPTYLKLEVYPLTRRNDLKGISTRRSRCFRPLETVVEVATGIKVPCDEIFLYKTTLLTEFKIEYNQAAIMAPKLSVPEPILAALESELTGVPTPYSLVYDSDDEDTRTILKRLPRVWSADNFVMEVQPCDAADLLGATAVADFSGINGWISEMTRVEELERMENGDLSDDSDDDSDTEYWDWPRAVDRRLSCTMTINSQDKT